MDSIGVHYGVRNVPVFTTWTRERLNFSRQTLAKYLGISPREVYYIELGRIPDEKVVTRLKALHTAAPVLCTLSSLIIQIWAITARLNAWLEARVFNYYLRITGQMLENGQLVLPCCV